MKSAAGGFGRPSPEEYEEVKQILESIGTIDPLDKHDELPLIYAAKQGDQVAMHTLIQAHLRMILQIASQRGSPTVPLPDRVQDGIEGLIDAVHRYDDPTGQTPLLAFARWRVLHHTQKAERSYREPATDPDTIVEGMSSDQPFEITEAALSSGPLMRIIQTALTSLEREIVTVLYLEAGEHGGIQELAASKGIPEAEIEAAHRRALKKLRELWVPEGRSMQQEETHEFAEPEETYGIAMIDPRQIIIGDRLREDLGEISELAESLKAIGMINPITITESNNLLAGRRRLEAALLLGWRKVPVRRIRVGGSANV